MYQAHPETQDTMESQVGRVIQGWERQAVTDHLAPKVNRASKGRRVRREPQACLGVLEKTVNVKKIPREENPSDALTHYWNAVDAVEHFKKISVEFREAIPACNVETFKPRGGVEWNPYMYHYI